MESIYEKQLFGICCQKLLQMLSIIFIDILYIHFKGYHISRLKISENKIVILCRMLALGFNKIVPINKVITFFEHTECYLRSVQNAMGYTPPLKRYHAAIYFIYFGICRPLKAHSYVKNLICRGKSLPIFGIYSGAQAG